MDKKIKSSKFNYSAKIITIVVRIFLFIWSVITIYPLIWTLYTSFKSSQDFLLGAWSLPSKWYIQNYIDAFKKMDFLKYISNSVFIVIGSVFLSLLFSSTSAYIVAKYKAKIVSILGKFYMIFMMIPQILLLVPLYFQCMNWNLLSSGINSFLTVMLIYSIQSLPFNIFILVPFLNSINNSILESAEIEGASQIAIFCYIVLPVSLPSVFIVGLLSVVGSWNEYIIAYSFIQESEYYTLSVGLSYLSTLALNQAGYGVKFAGLIIGLVPMLVIYGIFQKQLQQGFSTGDGVKE